MEMMANGICFQFRKLSLQAYAPTKATHRSVGYDLYSAYDVVIPGRGKGLVPLDLEFFIPDGYYGRIAPRSGLTWEHSLDVGAGVIDPDYRGNVCVVLFNHGNFEYQVKSGQRVAQLILEKCGNFPVQEVYSTEPQLGDGVPYDITGRGPHGFGSSGY